MKAILALTLFAGIAMPALAQDPQPAPKPAPVAEPKPADAAPKLLKLGERLEGTIKLQDIDGKEVVAKDLMGKVVVVNFFSITCPIQKDWDGRLAQIQKDFEGQGVVFLHVNSNSGNKEIGMEPPAADATEKPYDNIRKYLAEKKLPFRVLVDHKAVVADVFQARTTPHVYVFGKDGKLVYKGLVDDDQKQAKGDDAKHYLRDTLKSLAAGEKVEPFQTKEHGCTIKRVNAQAGERAPGQRGGRRGGDGGR